MVINFTPQFIRRYRKQEKKVREAFQRALLKFEADPFYPALRTHKLKAFEGLWSFRVTYAHRVLFYFLNNSEVKLVNIGDHSIYE